MRITVLTVILARMIMTISVRIRDAKISKNRDYSFFSKTNNMLRFKEKFFAYIMSSKITAVQVRNTTNRLYTILKNFKIEHLKDFNKKKCYLIASENRHLVINSSKQINEVIKTLKTIVRTTMITLNLNIKSMKTILSNEVTIYDDKFAINRNVTIINEFFDI